MEKILLAVDGQHIDPNAVSFACYLARLTQSKLTALVLSDLVLKTDIVINESEGSAFIESVSIEEMEDDLEREELAADNIALLRYLTEKEGVEAEVYLDKGVPASEMIAESRFSDLLVVDASTSFSRVGESAPTRFVKDILGEAECPVVISPESFSGIENIVFCYDGSKSAVFAMKQFIYLFPELRTKTAEVIYLREDTEFLEEDREGVIDWLAYHFNSVEFVSADGDAPGALFDYLLSKHDDMVVMGAYGRGLLDAFFSSEEQETVKRNTSVPIFISHY